MFLASGPSWADWKADVGYTRLGAELGAAVPDGTGVAVHHVEAAVTVGEYDTWMPDPTIAAFAGKTIVDRTGAPAGVYSGHATSVGRLFYGDPTSMASGIDEIDVFYAGHWLQNGYLYYGYGWQPQATDSRLANHSWVGKMDTDAQDAEVLRRLDWAVDRDEFLQTVGLTNSASSSRPLLASAFNVIAVGRTDGSHSRGSAAVDDIYTGGRNRPDLVVPVTTTSSATPIVGAAAALLIQAGHDNPSLSTDPVQSYTIGRAGTVIYNAERAEVVRAALMAGADRFTVNATAADTIDYRLDEKNCSDNGLDVRYGAGQLNVYQSYHIIAAGEQNSLEDGGSGSVGYAGFDYDPAFGGDGCNETATYFFTADESHNLLTVALVWHIRIDGGRRFGFDGAASLYDLDLELYDIAAGEVVAESVGNADNSEHLWIVLIPGQSYEIRVKPAAGQEAFSWDYALAWTTRADADRDLIPDDVDNCRLTANRKQTDSDWDGYGNRCDCDLDNNGRVDAGDFWRWRLLATVNPSSSAWDSAVDFNENGVADYEDYMIFISRYGQMEPYH
jgi:hypothetical protein